MVNAIQFGGSPKHMLWTPTPKKIAFACGGGGGSPCGECQSGTTKNQYYVQIAGLANGTCSNCAAYNGTVVVTQMEGFPCLWNYTFPSYVCGSHANSIGMLFASTFIEVQVGIYLEGYAVRFRLGTTWPYDCTFADWTSIPDVTSYGPCDSSGATCWIKKAA